MGKRDVSLNYKSWWLINQMIFDCVVTTKPVTRLRCFLISWARLSKANKTDKSEKKTPLKKERKKLKTIKIRRNTK